MKKSKFYNSVCALLVLASCTGSLFGIIGSINEKVSNKLTFVDENDYELETSEEVVAALFGHYDFDESSMIRLLTPSEIRLVAYKKDGILKVETDGYNLSQEVGNKSYAGVNGYQTATAYAGQDLTKISTTSKLVIRVDKDKSCGSKSDCDLEVNVDKFALLVEKNFKATMMKYTDLSIDGIKFDLSSVEVICDRNISASDAVTVSCTSYPTFKIGSAPRDCNYNGWLYGCK